MKFLKEVTGSFYNLNSYRKFIRKGVGSVLIYTYLLTLVTFILAAAIILAKFQLITGGIINVIEKETPDFKIENGALKVFGQIDFKSESNGGVFMYVNTEDSFKNSTGEEVDAAAENYKNVLIIDKEKFYMKDAGNGRIVSYKNEDLGRDTPKTELVGNLKKNLPFLYLGIIVAVSVITVFWILLGLAASAIYSILGMIISGVLGVRLSYSETFKLDVYAKTPFFIISVLLIVALLGYNFDSRLMLIGIAAHYVLFTLAVLNFKNKGLAPVSDEYEKYPYDNELDRYYNPPEKDYYKPDNYKNSVNSREDFEESWYNKNENSDYNDSRYNHSQSGHGYSSKGYSPPQSGRSAGRDNYEYESKRGVDAAGYWQTDKGRGPYVGSGGHLGYGQSYFDKESGRSREEFKPEPSDRQPDFNAGDNGGNLKPSDGWSFGNSDRGVSLDKEDINNADEE